MDPGPEGPDFFIRTGRMNAIGRQDDGHSPFDIHPERSSRKPQMADTVRRKIGSTAHQATRLFLAIPFGNHQKGCGVHCTNLKKLCSTVGVLKKYYHLLKLHD